jgi:hypothetical protein
MNVEHSVGLPHYGLTRRDFLGASAGAAAAAALPAALLTGASFGAAALTIKRREVYAALVEAVALLPMNHVHASRAAWATDQLSELYANADQNRRRVIDELVDSVAAPGRESRFVGLSPRARLAYLKHALAGPRPDTLLGSALDLAARPFREHHTELRVVSTFAYAEGP